MQTNHLSHFLLTKELLPLLNKAAAGKGEARIVNHSSGARKFPSGPLDTKYLGKNGGNLGGNGNSMLFGGARWQRYHQVRSAADGAVRAPHPKITRPAEIAGACGPKQRRRSARAVSARALPASDDS